MARAGFHATAGVVFFLVGQAVSPAAGYRQALPGYHFQFPRDHFNHPDFHTEWWYYTGNLRASDGRRYGFELVFFRQGQRRGSTANPSVWREAGSLKGRGRRVSSSIWGSAWRHSSSWSTVAACLPMLL